MKLMFWKKEEEQDAKNSVEIDSDKSVVEIDGKEIALTDAITAYQDQQAALANAKQKLDDEATVTIGDQKVKVSDLKNAYAAKMKNDDDAKLAEDHKEGKHKEDCDDCPMCNAAKNDAEAEAKEKADAEAKAKEKEKAKADEVAKNAAGLKHFEEVENLANRRGEPQELPLPKTRRDMAEQGRKEYGSLALVE